MVLNYSPNSSTLQHTVFPHCSEFPSVHMSQSFVLDPYLADNKKIFSFHNSFLDFLLDPFPNLILILVGVGTVQEPVPSINGSHHCCFYLPSYSLENED